MLCSTICNYDVTLCNIILIRSVMLCSTLHFVMYIATSSYVCLTVGKSSTYIANYVSLLAGVKYNTRIKFRGLNFRLKFSKYIRGSLFLWGVIFCGHTPWFVLKYVCYQVLYMCLHSKTNLSMISSYIRSSIHASY